MKEHPILFSAPMVRALLDGSKTQTRRICKHAMDAHLSHVVGPFNCPEFGPGWFGDEEGDIQFLGPYGQPGDRLYVRETWRTSGDGGRADYLAPRDLQPHAVWYDANGKAPADECVGKTRVSIHMPRWASRILLEIVSVRVERLNDCSDADALAEGIDVDLMLELQDNYDIVCAGTGAAGRATPQSMYRDLWESINGYGSWDANPLVWVVKFKRVLPL